MGQFAVGDAVAVSFPFSNLKGRKVRPALVLAISEFNNLILCQVTSKSYTSRVAVRIQKSDFSHGSLSVVSYIRPDKLFTADPVLVSGIVGKLTSKRRSFILKKVRDLF